MGCYLNMSCRKEDIEVVRKMLGSIEGEDGDEVIIEDEDDDSVQIQLYEADYGLVHERAALAAKGLAFYGYHEADSDYGPHVFAAMDGELIDVLSTTNLTPVVEVTASGGVHKKQLAKVRAYLKLRNRVEAAIHGTSHEREENKS